MGKRSKLLKPQSAARGRALLDLLAGKNLAQQVKEKSQVAVLNGSLPPLVSRGDSPSVSEARKTTASNVSVDSVMALAARLNSTILAYWVDDTSTTISTVSPAGKVTTARTNFGGQALDAWIDEAVRPGRGQAVRGDIELTTRAGDTVLARRGTQAPWRRLYDALIRPVRTALPAKLGSRLTIIPSGPLFRLSFAALLNEKGRYLVEDYALHYAPATEVFNYTRVTKERTARMPARYLLVANPAGLPLSSEGKPFPGLPGSDAEVRNIMRRLPAASVSMLQGKAADEASVRRTLESANVIHLATHGIVNSADPLGSFLAFGRSGDDADHNGRLTAAEVLWANLNANLVVLSACRTGLGRISGDGVAGGRTYYAGAASVVSTLWDVADQTAARLVSDFYQSLGNSAVRDKSEALRAAQLQLLSLLRKSGLRVDTPFGRLPLPEDPLLWAGFILMGEP